MKRAILLSVTLAAAGFLGACAQRNSAPPIGKHHDARGEAKPLFAAADEQRKAQPAAARQQPAQAKQQPATQPSGQAQSAPLPPGHPPVAQQPTQQAEQPKLPAGHPDIAEMMRQRQAQQGQPAQPAEAPESGQPGQPKPQLPAGHPPLPARPAQEQHGDAHSAHPEAVQEPALFGTLTIQATQRTPGGPAAGAATAVVELYHNEKVMSKIDVTLDASGRAVIPELPVTVPFQPAVKISYGGIEYQAVGHIMDSTHPNQELQVAVYEGTEEAPAWTVRMQHVMMQAVPEGLQVMEMLAIENPTDRAWIGAVDATGARSTFTLQLPPGAEHVQMLEGFDACCTKVENGRIINPKALVPGTTQYQYAYLLPIKDGQSQFSVTTAAPVKHLMVFVPEDGSTKAQASGLEDMGVSEMKNGKTRFFRAAALDAGQQVSLSLSGLKATAMTSASDTTAASGRAAQMVALGGGVLIFVIGGFFLFIRPKSAAKAA